MRSITRIAAALFYAGLVVQALAAPPLTGNIIGKQAFHGPGARGFHSTCSSNFSVTNAILNSSAFSSWTVAQNTSAPTLTPGVAGPDGSLTATQVSFPAVSGSGKFSVIDQAAFTVAQVNNYPFAFGVWAQVVSGATNGSVYISQSSGTTFVTTPIPSDGAWHLVTATSPHGKFGTAGQAAPQIGINLADTTNQHATTGPIVVNLWNAWAILSPLSQYAATPTNISGPLATAGSAVTATLNIPCPPGVAFRDFREGLPATGLAPAINNPIISENPTELYNAGGISNPYVTSTPLYYQGSYWGFANSTSNSDHGFWMSFALYKSKDGINWTEVTTNAPYLQTFGSVIAVAAINAGGTGYDTGTVATGTMTWTGSGCAVPLVLNVATSGAGVITSATRASGVCTTWPAAVTTWTPGGGLAAGSGAKFTFSDTKGTGVASFWQLHPAWLPYGCTISGTSHQFCLLYGAETATTNSYATYLAWSDTIDGVYTPVGCTGPGTCAAPTPMTPITNTFGSGLPTGGFLAAQNLPAVVNVGGPSGINYIFTGIGNAGSASTYYFTSPAIPTGAPFTWTGGSLLPAIAGVDWDGVGTTSYLDPSVMINKCGFYEMFYTAFNAAGLLGTAKQQAIGYAVSNSPNGPWWKYDGGPIVPVTSSMYFGTNFIGDSSPIVVNGRFIWLGNYDNGTSQSRTVAAVMQDACSY